MDLVTVSHTFQFWYDLFQDHTSLALLVFALLFRLFVVLIFPYKLSHQRILV